MRRPTRDPLTGETHAIAYDGRVWDRVRHLVLAPTGQVVRDVAIAVAHGPCIHDCAITARFVIVLDLPVTFSLRALLARHNREAFYKYPFGPRGLYWFSKQTFGPADDMARDELLARFLHYSREIAAADRRLEELRPRYPQAEALTELYGIGLYSRCRWWASSGT